MRTRNEIFEQMKEHDFEGCKKIVGIFGQKCGEKNWSSNNNIYYCGNCVNDFMQEFDYPEEDTD